MDFVAVRLTLCFHISFWLNSWLTGIFFFLFAFCRVYKPSVVLGIPNLAMALPSMCTPATAPWLTGECVCVCICSIIYKISTYRHGKKRICGYTLMIIRAHPLFLFQVLQQLRWRLSDWWGKEMLMFSLSTITRTMTAQSSALFLLQFSFSLFFFCLFVSLVPQQGEILITTEFGKMRVEPNEICVVQVSSMFFISPVFIVIYYYICSQNPLTVFKKTKFGAFQKGP